MSEQVKPISEKYDALQSKLTEIEARNVRLKSELEESNLFRERNRRAINQRDDDLAAHKSALEKARVFICQTPVYPLNDWFQERDELLAAITALTPPTTEQTNE